MFIEYLMYMRNCAESWDALLNWKRYSPCPHGYPAQQGRTKIIKQSFKQYEP